MESDYPCRKPGVVRRMGFHRIAWMLHANECLDFLIEPIAVVRIRVCKIFVSHWFEFFADHKVFPYLSDNFISGCLDVRAGWPGEVFVEVNKRIIATFLDYLMQIVCAEYYGFVHEEHVKSDGGEICYQQGGIFYKFSNVVSVFETHNTGGGKKMRKTM